MKTVMATIAFAIGIPTGVPAVELPVSFVDNRPFVEVRIDGQGPFTFLVDTGSSVTTLSADLGRRLRLRPVGSGQGSGAGNDTVSYKVVHIPSITVGSVLIGPLDAPTIDEKRLSQVVGFRKFDGVLGAEIFKAHAVTLNTARKRIRIENTSQFRRSAGSIAIPFQLDENDMPVIEATVAGVTGSFQVDTGDRSSLTLFGPFGRKYEFEKRIAPTVVAMTGYGVGGPILAIVGRPASAEIGPVALPAPVARLSLQTRGSFVRADRAGSIGMGILKRFNITFDYQHHTIWLVKGRTFDAPDFYDRSGLWLGLADGDALQVIAVTPGSPAAHAGMRPGDAVKRVGSLSATAANLPAIRRLLQSPDVPAVTISAARSGRPYHRNVVLKDQISAARSD